ncbi:MAG TPA: class I tRNA ligase family protein, partial [Dehalococcoidia bacterium]|nr:class I tRNA ligase family protein [Dehalococcoidia bacterium]
PEAAWGAEARAFREGRLVPPEGQPPPRRVIAAGFVSLEEGTGIVHIAPAFGQEDFEAGKREGLIFLQPIDAKGEFTGGPWQGLFVKEADPLIMQDLQERGLLFRGGTLLHTYPFCWRCDSPLLYFAKPTWYIRTTAVKELLLEGNERINWHPAHIKHGRFGDWLQNNVDWALSRERYWGTPLPIWECEHPECGSRDCLGSLAELRERAADPVAVDALSDLHRPYVDEVEISCPGCGGPMRRLPDVIDCWFDSGAMPYAQWHYPFQNQEAFRRAFPADFICEAVDQTRGWFYTLHAEAALLNHVGVVDEPQAYRNVICLGHVLDDQGRKMSKSLGNVVDPWSVIDLHGADALRWYLLTASPAGNPRRFSGELVAEVVRQFLLTLWNVYSFFVTYARIDGFDPRQPPAGANGQTPLLDRWLLSELHRLTQRVTEHLDGYNPTDAGRAMAAFVDDLSNWYVRLSRRRFWKSESDADKLAAYQTLYTCLVTLSKLLAPLLPFTAEAIYQNLVRSCDKAAPESVHLCDWPHYDERLIDEGLMSDMRVAMQAVSLGRAARSKAGIKVRQPLARALVRVRTSAEADGVWRLASLVASELNVKEVALVSDLEPGTSALVEAEGYALALDTELTPELRDEGLARELVHRLQSMRKKAGFQIADRIRTYYQGDADIRRVMERHGDYIRAETLSRELVEGLAPPGRAIPLRGSPGPGGSGIKGAYGESQRVDGHPVALAVERVE